ASSLAASHSVTAAEESIHSDTINTMTIMGKTYSNTATKTALEPEETKQAININDKLQLQIR
ncbi:hypothetical protein, partial [Psychromonas aquatilis]